MTPIISPWVFYWIEVLENVSCLCGTLIFFGIILAGACIIFLPILIDTIDIDVEDFTKIAPKILKKVVSIFIVIVIVGTFIPSKETMYTMLVAENVTVENLEVATDVIKDSVDYIFDKFDGGDEE